MQKQNRKEVFEELNEFSEHTRIIGRQYFTKLQPTFRKIESERTQRVEENKTVRIGKTKESSVVDEIWTYYQNFNESNPPEITKYFGGEQAEMNISILIRLFHDFYLEKIYPPAFPVPIIQKSYINSRNRVKKYAKFFFIGDTHGSFKDVSKLVRFLTMQIEQSENLGYDVKIVFIGDIVDRGKWDLHNLLYLMVFNLKFPNNVLVLRGNHEEISICAHYGFGKRVMDNFSQMLFASFIYMFKDLPLIAIYRCDEGNIMCLHGGIPIQINEETQGYEVPVLINHKFDNRQLWIDDMDPITKQILWNDPIINYDSSTMKPYYRSHRGLGYEFGKEIFQEFCIKNKVDLLFRGHQVFRQGYHQDFDNRFITVFSASEYINKMIDARFIELNSNNIFNFQMHVIQNLQI